MVCWTRPIISETNANRCNKYEERFCDRSSTLTASGPVNSFASTRNCLCINLISHAFSNLSMAEGSMDFVCYITSRGQECKSRVAKVEAGAVPYFMQAATCLKGIGRILYIYSRFLFYTCTFAYINIYLHMSR